MTNQPKIPPTVPRDNQADKHVHQINTYIDSGNPSAALIQLHMLSQLLAKGGDLPRVWNVGSRNVLDGTYEFMRQGNQIPKAPTVEMGFHYAPHNVSQYLNPERRQLRRKLLSSEFLEYMGAEDDDDLPETVDGLLDIIVVAWGTLIEYVGIELAKKCAAEVVRTNLSKVDGSLGPTQFNDDGKILKPPGWEGPKIKQVLGDLLYSIREAQFNAAHEAP